jgi:ABC-type uncharacterized transport system permease subunit
MIEALDLLWNASLWAAVLRIATPLIFGVLGALLCERAGVLNLGIEGIMTMGAMVGWLSVFLGSDLWTGLLIAAAAGALMGLLHAMLTVPLGLSQHVSGLGITLFASALAYCLYRLIVEVGESPPTIEPFHPLELPVLSDIPFLGPVLFGQAAPTYLALIAVAVMAYVLNRTPLGLAIRMTGENPHAVEAQGLDPTWIRIGCVMVGSALRPGGDRAAQRAGDGDGLRHRRAGGHDGAAQPGLSRGRIRLLPRGPQGQGDRPGRGLRRPGAGRGAARLGLTCPAADARMRSRRARFTLTPRAKPRRGRGRRPRRGRTTWR